MENRPAKLNASKRLAFRGVMIALAMILSYAESLIPFTLAVPGAKIGLANIVTLIALLELGIGDAFAVSLIRVFLTGILFGNTVMMVYSLAGAVLSVLVMSLLSRLKAFGIIGISIAGAVSHNLGQCLAAALLMKTQSILWYLPLLVIYGVISGLITGFLASETMARTAAIGSWQK